MVGLEEVSCPSDLASLGHLPPRAVEEGTPMKSPKSNRTEEGSLDVLNRRNEGLRRERPAQSAGAIRSPRLTGEGPQ